MKLHVHTKQRDYDIFQQRGILAEAKDYIGDTDIYIVTDSGVPACWKELLCKQYPKAPVYEFPAGEQSKNLDTWQNILRDMMDHGVKRNDTLIALGGGVTGDLAGFAAASYMRGIRYINIPTTTLSQIDSSIGGKTAVDFNGVKNSVGAFWQPSLVLIDPDVLSTLSARHVNNGLAEAVKEGMIRDASLFEIFEKDDYLSHIDEIITKCLIIKRDIVEKDERESGERKLLNFGHTFGHAYESLGNMREYLHGECVAMGMMRVLENREIKDRLKSVLERLELPVSCPCDPEAACELLKNDKKADHDTLTIVQVHEIGNGILEKWTYEKVREVLGI